LLDASLAKTLKLYSVPFTSPVTFTEVPVAGETITGVPSFGVAGGTSPAW
jgi:hypothetical protein